MHAHMWVYTHICINVYIYINRYDPKYLFKLSLMMNDQCTSSNKGSNAEITTYMTIFMWGETKT